MVANDVRPQHEGRDGDEAGIETDHVNIVVEMLAVPAGSRPAGRARVALAVVTDAANVVAGLIGEEDVGAEIVALALALEAAAGVRERGKIHRRVNRHEHVRILRDRLAGRERSDESDAQDARTDPSRKRESDTTALSA